MKGHILDSGFANVRVTGSFSPYYTLDDIAFIYGLANDWFLTPEITEAAIKYGAATEDLCNAIRVAYDRWKDNPAAFVAIAYGEVVANKPLS